MAIENVGPGGVGNNYGVRETVARERYELDKEYIEEYTDADGKVVTSKVDPVTGGVGIFGPDGKQIGGNGAPYAFTSRALTAADNGMTRVLATAQVATVNTGLPAGFACLFDGPISFNGTATVTDDRDVVTGKNNCVMYAIGTDAYRVVGKKGA